MSFDRVWVLALAWVPLAWMAFEWRRTRRRGALVLKTLSFIAILLALAGPSMSVSETKVALAVLVDTSASVPPAGLERASQIANQIADHQGRHWLRVIPFARSTRPLDRSEEQKPWRLRQTAGEPGRATDLEAAIREAAASLPAGMVPRIALISDGRQNEGSVARAAWQARQLGLPIDTFALKGRPEPALRLESASAPSIAYTGEQFPIDLVVSSPSAGPAEVELSAEGRALGTTQVQLTPGENQIRLHASLNTPGALDVSIAVHAQGSELRFDQAVILRQPRVLYVSSDPASEDSHLTSTLTAAKFAVQRTTDFTALNLADNQLVVFDNWDLEHIAPPRKAAVENYVKQGGGLLVIGGDRSVYVEKKQEDALDRALPAKLAPPRTPEGTAVVLIVDKSSSMEGRKIELARLAASGVVDNLRPVDLVGVLIFDNSFQWAVPIRRAGDRVLIKRLIAGISPDGGTQIAPALKEAYAKILPAHAVYKHIVLLTDGISEEGDSVDLAREALAQHITISTVGLGQDVNRGYLEKVAETAGGKSYFLDDPAGLERLLLKDVKEHTGSTAIEKPLKPEVVRHAEILDGIDMETAPPLKGYIKFIAKPTAETILRLDGRDPLLSRWQYGLGRAAVFASDAKARWAADWIGWNGYDKFWTNLCRDLLPQAQAGEATLNYDSASGDLVAEYRLGREVEEPARIPEIFAFGPEGFERPVPVKKIAAGVFRGRVRIGSRQGLFRVRPLEESRAFPEAGLYRPEAELANYGANTALLRQVAQFTGGRFEPDPKDAFDAGGRSIASTMHFWPGLIALAILLSLIELVLRKWKGVIGGAN
ncbi:MAG: VWA domain-containing protein [Bryobacteraceae bacterium]